MKEVHKQCVLKLETAWDCALPSKVVQENERRYMTHRRGTDI